jgi:hypothetical protein
MPMRIGLRLRDERGRDQASVSGWCGRRQQTGDYGQSGGRQSGVLVGDGVLDGGGGGVVRGGVGAAVRAPAPVCAAAACQVGVAALSAGLVG